MVLLKIKQYILLVSALCAGQIDAQESELPKSFLIGKDSESIINTEFSATCTVNQGDHITLVACENGYELYDTMTLAMKTVGLVNYGENRKATAVNRSLQTGKNGHLTYLVDGLTVVSAHYNEADGTIVKDKLLNLALETTSEGAEVVTDLFVFDNLVAARVNNANLKFFPLPLVQGDEVINEIPMEVDMDRLEIDQQFANYTGIKAYGMHWSKDSEGGHLYNLLAALHDRVVKVSYQHDSYENKITHEVVIHELYDLSEQYGGSQMRGVVSVGDFVVSCADCKKPSVKWYDHDLDLIHTEDMPFYSNQAYELAAYVQPDLVSLQTYIAGPTEINVFLQVTDENNNHYFSKRENTYEFRNQTNTTISLDKGQNYLVFKTADRDVLSIVPACENDAYFDSESWSCKLCDDGLRSWGLQTDTCEPCIRIWWYRNADDYAAAQYEHMCTDGIVKSLILFILVPFISLVLAICLCCATRENGLDEEKPCCSMLKTEAPQKVNRKVVSAKGFNRKNSSAKQLKKRRKARPEVVSRHSEHRLAEPENEGGQRRVYKAETARNLLTLQEEKDRIEIEMEHVNRQRTHQEMADQQKDIIDEDSSVDEEAGLPGGKNQDTPDDGQNSMLDFQRDLARDESDSAQVSDRDNNVSQEKFERKESMRTTSKNNNRKPHH